MNPPLMPKHSIATGQLTPIGELVPLYVDGRFCGMDKKWAVQTIVAGRLARDTARGNGLNAARRGYGKVRLRSALLPPNNNP